MIPADLVWLDRRALHPPSPDHRSHLPSTRHYSVCELHFETLPCSSYSLQHTLECINLGLSYNNIHWLIAKSKGNQACDGYSVCLLSVSSWVLSNHTPLYPEMCARMVTDWLSCGRVWHRCVSSVCTAIVSSLSANVPTHLTSLSSSRLSYSTVVLSVYSRGILECIYRYMREMCSIVSLVIWAYYHSIADLILRDVSLLFVTRSVVATRMFISVNWMTS